MRLSCGPELGLAEVRTSDTLSRRSSGNGFSISFPHDLPVPTPPGSIDRMHYHPNSYPGHIVLFWAAEGWARLNRTPDLGWARLADGGLSVRVLPGRHHTMADGADARILARHVTECLTQA